MYSRKEEIEIDFYRCARPGMLRIRLKGMIKIAGQNFGVQYNRPKWL